MQSVASSQTCEPSLPVWPVQIECVVEVYLEPVGMPV